MLSQSRAGQWLVTMLSYPASLLPAMASLGTEIRRRALQRWDFLISFCCPIFWKFPNIWGLISVSPAMYRGHTGRPLHLESWCWTSSHPLHRKELFRKGEGDFGKAARSRPGRLGGLILPRIQGTSSEQICFYHLRVFCRTYYNHDHLLYKHFSGMWPYLL